MPARAYRRQFPVAMIIAAVFVTTPKPAQAQLIDLTPILDALLDLDTRVTLLNGQLVTVNADLNANAALIAGVSIDLDVLSGRVDAHGARLADIDVSMAGNNVRIGANTAAIADLDVRVDNAEVRLDAHDGALATLDTRVTANDRRDDGQDAALLANARRDDSQDAALRSELASGAIGLVRQQGGSAPIAVGAGTGGAAISFAGTGGDRRLTGVATGTAANDAANVAQVAAGDAATLASANTYTDDRMAQMALDFTGEGASVLIAENNAVLRKDMNAIAAGTSALAGLPQAFVPGRGMMGASIGGKGEEVAFAMGLSKAFDSGHVPVVRAGAAIDARRGTVGYNASVGIHF